MQYKPKRDKKTQEFLLFFFFFNLHLPRLRMHEHVMHQAMLICKSPESLFTLLHHTKTPSSPNHHPSLNQTFNSKLKCKYKTNQTTSTSLMSFKPRRRCHGQAPTSNGICGDGCTTCHQSSYGSATLFSSNHTCKRSLQPCLKRVPGRLAVLQQATRNWHCLCVPNIESLAAVHR